MFRNSLSSAIQQNLLFFTLIQKIIVCDDKLEIFFNYTNENNPDDTSRQDYLLPKCSTYYGMVEINGFCRYPEGDPSARHRALPSHERRAIYVSYIVQIFGARGSLPHRHAKRHPKWVPFAWWTETIQIRTLLSVFQKSGSALSLICLKNCKRAYSSSISS